MHRAWDAGDLIRFAGLRDLLAPLHEALFLESNPIPLKAAMAMLRLCAPDVRLPLTRAGRPARERLAEILFRIASIEEGAASRPAPALAH